MRSQLVKQLPRAPFLQYVHSDPLKSHVTRAISHETFTCPSGWEEIRAELQKLRPDGLVLIHPISEGDKMKPMEAPGNSGKLLAGVWASDGDISGTRHWGVVVQSPFRESATDHDCFILTTTSTNGATWYSLCKAKCEGLCLHDQLEQWWIER